MIEIVSPGNKSGADDLDEFVRKVREVLRAGIHRAVIDLLPPGRFDPEGIHGAIVEAVTGEKYELPEGEPLTFVSYSSGPEPVAYLQHPHPGDEVPGLPLFLTPAYYIQLPLEPAYAMASSGVPAFWREVIEGKRPAPSDE